MAATVNIMSCHGATGATAANIDGTSIRYKVADNDTFDANNPIPIPAAGSNYSYIKQFRFTCAVTPANQLTNLKVYSDGANSFGTGIDLQVKTAAAYTDPTVQATTALTGTASVFTYTSAAPLSVTGTLNNPSTGAFGDYIVTQMSIASTAVLGSSGNESLTFQWDES